MPDWLEYDLEGVRKYKAISKAPVFSHDELLMTIYSYEESPKSCKWLLPLFEEMVTRELAEREKARAEIPILVEVVEDEEQDDDQYQCMTDKSFCYLSQIVTKDRLNVACADHWRSLPEGDKVMKIRFKDEDLRAMLEQVRKRAELSIIAPVPVALAEKVSSPQLACSACRRGRA